MISFNKLICNLFLLFIIVYLAQGGLYTSGALLGKISLLLWLAIAVFYNLKFVFKREKNKLGWSIFIFWIVIALYWLFSPKIIDGYITIRTMDMFKLISAGWLSYFPFYYFFKQETLSIEKIKTFLIICLILSVILFIRNDREFGSSTNNFAYRFVMLLPLAGVFLNKKLVFFAIYFVSLFFVIWGSKRGAIVCFAMQSILAFYFLLNEDRRRINRNYLIGIIFLIVTAYVSYSLYIQNPYLQGRIELAQEGSFSGRDVIYEKLFDRYIQGSLTNLLFGYGFEGSVHFVGAEAHNDWLELLTGHGIFGVVLYLSVLFVLIKLYVSNRENMNSSDKFMYLAVLFTIFIKSLFSMSYSDISMAFNLLIILFVLNRIDNETTPVN